PDRVFVPLRRRVVRRTGADLTYRPPGSQPDVSGNGDSVSGLLTHNSPFCPQNGVLLTERIYTISVERYRCGAECEGERNDKFEDSVRERRGPIPLGSTRRDGSTTIGYAPNVGANHERRIGTTCFAAMARI